MKIFEKISTVERRNLSNLTLEITRTASIHFPGIFMPAIRFPFPIIHTKEIIVLLYTYSQSAFACLGIITNDNSGARVFVHRGPLDGVTQKYRGGWLSREIEGMPGNLWPRGVNKRSDPTASFVPACKQAHVVAGLFYVRRNQAYLRTVHGKKGEF